jgi:triosephosphate isomerase
MSITATVLQKRRLVAANWKMNLLPDAAQNLATQYQQRLNQFSIPVIAAVPAPYLPIVVPILKAAPQLYIAAQNVHSESFGAYTGEISAPMLAALGCSYALVGHSERRQYFGETNEFINQKINKLLTFNLRPILCIGETEAERAADYQAVLVQQLEACLLTHPVPLTQWTEIVIAYEPVWAIGTGLTATPEQAQEAHQCIRQWIKHKTGEAVAEQISIIYGGSVNPQNAAALFEQPDVDGALVGGAGLKAADFEAIVRARAGQ